VTTVNLQNTGEQTRTTEPDSTASLEKVRDLLFGVQMRDFDRKFARLEERLVQDTSELREDVKKRLASIEQLLGREIESLNERLKAEHDDRTASAANLSRQFEDAGRGFEKRTAQIDDQLARNTRELRQQIHEQYQQLSDELKQKANEILERLARESQELRSDKTDRASLAALLTEMAMRLTDDFRLPPSAELESRG
jgi:type VI protein secretion system component VasK